ncbi:MAG: phosphoheptose isomerase [Tardiphaga sp.]|nr:phosphoheptose isomerase [Tardiphaga sp.]
MTDIIAAHLHASRDAMIRATEDAGLLATAQAIANAIVAALQAGHQIFLIGNGGSAADAQHIAAEIVGRYKKERAGWAAVALTTDTSALTSIANDYGFEQIFTRQIEALGQRGDVLIALSTSGRSPNILGALAFARGRGLVTVGCTGIKGESMRACCDHLLVSPSDDTPIIQQIHMAALHGICDAVERALTA